MSRSSRSPTSLHRKTLTSLVAVVGVVALTGGLIETRALERQAVDRLSASLLALGRFIEPEISRALTAAPQIAAIQPLAVALEQRGGCRVTVIDPSGRVLGDSEQALASVPMIENHGNRPEVKAALSGRVGQSLRYSTTLKHPMLYVALPVYSQARLAGVLRLSVPLTVVAELRREIRRTVTISLVVGLLAALSLGAWLARRIAEPLRRLARVAQDYSRGQLSATPSAAPIREVQELSEALTQMAQALSRHIGELTAERNQLSAILQSMTEGVVAVDAKGTILLINPAVGMLLGVDVSRAVGQRLAELIRVPELHELVHTIGHERRPAATDIRVYQPQQRALRVHAASCEGQGSSGPSAVLVIEDITEHSRFEQLRREFVANVSHELKSPLTAIRGLTETLLAGALQDPPARERFVQLIDEDARRLTRLVDDLLSLAQIESQAVPLALSNIELSPLIESVAASLKPGLEQRRLTLEMALAQDLVIRADPDRIRQVLANLLDNAIKYNKEAGTIRIASAREGDRAKILIADTGIGIPEQDVPRIFERFYRVDKARSRELGGTGLGLSIVKHIVEAHGGSVAVDSRLHDGSTFTVILPLAR